MVYRNKLLTIMTSVILIPVLLGMTPLDFIQKIGNGCPLARARQTLKCNPCPFNSVVSQEDRGIARLPSTPLNDAPIDLPGFELFNSCSITSNIALAVVPLRC